MNIEQLVQQQAAVIESLTLRVAALEKERDDEKTKRIREDERIAEAVGG